MTPQDVIIKTSFHIIYNKYIKKRFKQRILYI
nr:MAG TPA: hypothetical protein [Caudoviricetes sp.]